MNSRTVKLLKRYALETSGNYDELKRAWVAMNHLERARTRREMEAALAAQNAPAAPAGAK